MIQIQGNVINTFRIMLIEYGRTEKKFNALNRMIDRAVDAHEPVEDITHIEWENTEHKYYHLRKKLWRLFNVITNEFFTERAFFHALAYNRGKLFALATLDVE